MTAQRLAWERVLASPRAYARLMRLLGADSGMAKLVDEHLLVRPAHKVLDLGCGPGRLLPYLPPVHYCGLDSDGRAINRALALHPGAHFERQDVASGAPRPDLRGCDLVLALGLLHHVPDAAARRVLTFAHACMRPGGRLVTLDCAIEPGQPLAARLLAYADRGRFVRRGCGYLGLVRETFADASLTLRSDLLRVPYTHAIIEASKP